MADVHTLLRDPAFRRLSPEAQLYGLTQSDPGFGKLSRDAQMMALRDPELQPQPRTPLAPGDERRFQHWYKRYAEVTGNDPDPNEPEHFYDYRGFWKEDQGRTPLERGMHLTDTYKIPGHPTYFVRPGVTESKYKAAPAAEQRAPAPDEGPQLRGPRVFQHPMSQAVERMKGMVFGDVQSGGTLIGRALEPRPSDPALAALDTRPPALQEPLVRPEALSPERGPQRAALQFAGGLTTPENLAILGGMGVLGRARGVGQALQRLTSGGFSVAMIKSAFEADPEWSDASQRGDYRVMSEIATRKVLELAMGAAAGKHAAFPKAPAAPVVERAAPKAEAAPPPIPDKALEVVRTAPKDAPIAAKYVADEMGIPTSAARDVLGALRDAGHLELRPDGRYYRVAEAAPEPAPAAPREAAPPIPLEEVAQRTEEAFARQRRESPEAVLEEPPAPLEYQPQPQPKTWRELQEERRRTPEPSPAEPAPPARPPIEQYRTLPRVALEEIAAEREQRAVEAARQEQLRLDEEAAEVERQRDLDELERQQRERDRLVPSAPPPTWQDLQRQRRGTPGPVEPPLSEPAPPPKSKQARMAQRGKKAKAAEPVPVVEPAPPPEPPPAPEIPIAKEKPRDLEDQARLPGEERKGQEPVEAEPVERAGPEEAGPGGVLQEAQEVAGPAPPPPPPPVPIPAPAPPVEVAPVEVPSPKSKEARLAQRKPKAEPVTEAAPSTETAMLNHVKSNPWLSVSDIPAGPPNNPLANRSAVFDLVDQGQLQRAYDKEGAPRYAPAGAELPKGFTKPLAEAGKPGVKDFLESESGEFRPERLKELAAVGLKPFATKGKEWYRSAISSRLMEDARDLFGPMLSSRIARAGKGAGKPLAEALERTNQGETTGAGRVERLSDAGLTKLSRDEWFNLKDAMQGRAKPKNSKVERAFVVAREILDEIGGEAIDLDVKVRDREGNLRPFAEVMMEHYFPHVIRKAEALRAKGDLRTDVIENLQREKPKLDEASATKFLDDYLDYVENIKEKPGEALIQHVMEKHNVDSAKALAMLHRFRDRERGPRRQGSIEYEREVDLPFYDPHPLRVLPSHALGTSMRLAQIRELGQDNQILNKHIEAIKEATSTQDAKRVRDEVDQVLGWVDDANTVEGRWSRGIRAYQSLKLGMAGIKNVAQGFMSSAIKGDLPAAFAGVHGLMTESGRRFARESGATLDQTMREMTEGLSGSNKLSEQALRAYLKPFTKTEQGNRIIAANAGKNWSNRMLDRLKRSDGKDKFARETLEELGINPDAALKRGKLTVDEVLNAGRKFSDASQFRTRPQDLPKFMSSPGWKVALQYKSFIYHQTRFLARHTIGELQRGNVSRGMRNLFYMTALFPGTFGEGITDLLYWIKGKKRKSAYFSIARQFENAGNLATLGMINDLVESGEHYRGGVQYLAGPTYGDVGEAISIPFGKNKAQRTKRLLLRQVPPLKAAVEAAGR